MSPVCYIICFDHEQIHVLGCSKVFPLGHSVISHVVDCTMRFLDICCERNFRRLYVIDVNLSFVRNLGIY